MKILKWCALGAILTVGALSHAQVTPKSGGYLFRVKFKPGAVYKYGMSMNMSNASAKGNDMKMQMPMTFKIVSVKKGVAEIKYTMGNPTAMGTQTQGQTTSLTVRMNDRGEMVGGNMPEMQGLSVALPKNPVKIGQIWTSVMPMASLGPGSTAKTTYKLLGIKSIAGQQVANISVNVVGQGQTSLKGSGTMQLLMKDGFPMGSTMLATMTPKKMEGQKTSPKPVNLSISLKKL